MHILVSNDDGIFAPGIVALVNVLKCEHEVTVCAPDRERSAAGQSITLSDPIKVKPYEWEGVNAFSLSGTPSDCVRLGLRNIISKPVDLVISGINSGLNIGSDCHYSGTVSAAKEGLFVGIPAMAVSCQHNPKNGFEYAAKLTLQLANSLLKNGLPQGQLLNVNFPDLPEDDIKGYKVTNLNMQEYFDEYCKYVTPRNEVCYFMGKEFAKKVEQQTDVDSYWLHEGYITLTPLTWDMTAKSSFECVANLIK